jgi:hypothetical protein
VFRLKPWSYSLLALGLMLLVPNLLFAASPVVANEPIVPSFDRISWAAVIAGAVVALALHMTLSSLGVGLGAAMVAPYDRKNPVHGVPTMMMAWMFGSGLVSLAVGGWLSGRLAGTVPFDSMIHGVITWSLATVVMFLLATTSLGVIVGGTFHVMSVGASTAAQAVGAIAPEAAKMAKDAISENAPTMDWKNIEHEAKKLLTSPEKQGTTADEAIGDMLTKAYSSVRDNLPAADRESMLELVTSKTGVTKDEANKTLDKWEKMYGDAKQKYQQALNKAEATARDTAAAAKKAVTQLGIWTFASLLLGAAVSGFAGNLGSTYFRL